MKKLYYLLFFSLILASCGGSENRVNVDGKWNAQWKADPLSFPGMSTQTQYTMNGEFIFEGNNLTVTAMGYPNCLFGEDTISHTQEWKISQDTLYLISEPGITGISYLIESQSTDSIQLQLMEDIKVLLIKSQSESI